MKWTACGCSGILGYISGSETETNHNCRWRKILCLKLIMESGGACADRYIMDSWEEGLSTISAPPRLKIIIAK